MKTKISRTNIVFSKDERTNKNISRTNILFSKDERTNKNTVRMIVRNHEILSKLKKPQKPQKPRFQKLQSVFNTSFHL